MFGGYSCCLDSPQGKMIMQDKLEKERNDAKNNVEEYVYDMRDKLHGMLEKFVGESVSKRSPLTHLLRKDCGYSEIGSLRETVICESS